MLDPWSDSAYFSVINRDVCFEPVGTASIDNGTPAYNHFMGHFDSPTQLCVEALGLLLGPTIYYYYALILIV